MIQVGFVRKVIVHCPLDHGMGVRVWENHLQMHNQSDWLTNLIFRSPTHDEFLQVVVEILFVKRRRVDRDEELFEVPEADFNGILALLNGLRDRSGEFEVFIVLSFVARYSNEREFDFLEVEVIKNRRAHTFAAWESG